MSRPESGLDRANAKSSRYDARPVSKDLRVLMVAPGFSVHARRPLRWLIEAGCEVTFMDDGDPPSEPRSAYRHERLPAVRGDRVVRALLGEEIARWRRLRRWTRGLRARRGFDVVHVHWVDDRALACARAGQRPLVISVWGSDVNNVLAAGADPRERARVGEALAGADVVVIDDPGMKARAETVAGRPLATELIHVGAASIFFAPVPAEDVRRWRERLGVPEGTRLLLSVRGWSAIYRHDHILEAFARASRLSAVPSVLVFKVSNAPGYSDATSLERSIRARVAELGLSEHVRWLEGDVPADAMPALYRAADAILNAPLQDTLPVTFLEAAASERAVVTTRLPSYEGTFAERTFRMAPDDVDAFARAIADELATPTSPERLAAARSEVEREYSEAVSARRLLALYRRLATG